MFRKLLYSIIIIALIVPSIANAQPKPKRDISKDRSVIKAQQKKQAQKRAIQVESQKKKQQSAKKRRTRPIVAKPQHATYLRVDQQTYLSKTYSSNSGNETLSISTDGKEWVVSHLPSWCSITKYSKSFVLYYDANPSHDDRYDWIIVKSDNKEVRININQLGKPLNIYANFYYASLKHNVSSKTRGTSSSSYLKINTNVTIKGAKGQKCLIVAYISDENYNPIKAAYGYSYYGMPSSNNVYVAKEVTPSTDDDQKFYIDLSLPNNAMKLIRKKNRLNCHLAVYCVKTSCYVKGADYTLYFRAKNKKGKVTTKKL